MDPLLKALCVIHTRAAECDMEARLAKCGEKTSPKPTEATPWGAAAVEISVQPVMDLILGFTRSSKTVEMERITADHGAYERAG